MLKRATFLSVITLVSGLAFSQSAYKEIIPGALWPDNHGIHINAHGGGILVYGGRYYWFGERKTAGPEGNTAMVGFSCYSSDNLYDWKNEGIILKFSEDSTSAIRKVYIMEGRDFAKGQMARDMTLFVDDDGKAYHIYSSEENSTTQISLLTDDYLSFAGKYARAFVGRYMEAPALFKHKEKYYFIGSNCTGWDPNAARSAVAANMLGPWKELGNPCRGTNEENEKTFWSQSTYILPVAGKKNAFIFMATGGTLTIRSMEAISGCPFNLTGPEIQFSNG
jgi:hypothetical protein